MGDFGDRLRQAREARGATLEHVAEATRIQRRHLEALERGDLSSLPAAPFARGYIKAYAQHVGLDPQPTLEAYRAELHRLGRDTGATRSKMVEELSHIVAQRASGAGSAGLAGKGSAVAAGLAVLVLAGAVGWLLSRSTPPDTAEREAAPSSPSPSPRPSPNATPDEPTTAATTTADHPATPSPSPRPRPARVANAALRVSEFGVGTGVSNHRLVGRGDRFADGTQVAFWTLVTGGEPGDVIRHVWFHRGQAVMRADLEIGGPYWRTFSRRELPRGATGDWAVEARGPDGVLLARQEFVCVPDEP